MGYPNNTTGMLIAALAGGIVFSTLLFFFILIYLKRKKRLAIYQRLQQELSSTKRRQSRTKSCFGGLTTVLQEHGKAPRFSIPDTKLKTRPKETCELKCSLQYNFHTEILNISVDCVVNLPRLFGLQSGVFVKVRLLTSDEGVFKELGKTATHLSSQNPIFKETFETGAIPYVELKEMVVHLELYSCDRFNQSHFIGDVGFKIDNIHLSPLEAIELWRAVQPKNELIATRSKGQLIVSLRYQKKTGRINVVVMKANNLITPKRLLRTDPYVVIKLVLDEKVVEKKRTQPCKKTLNPVWNEPFVFDWKNGSSSGFKFVFIIRSSDFILPDATLGMVEVCQDSSEHWAEMMKRQNYARAMAHEVQ